MSRDERQKARIRETERELFGGRGNLPQFTKMQTSMFKPGDIDNLPKMQTSMFKPSVDNLPKMQTSMFKPGIDNLPKPAAMLMKRRLIYKNNQNVRVRRRENESGRKTSRSDS